MMGLYLKCTISTVIVSIKIDRGPDCGHFANHSEARLQGMAHI